MKPIAVLKLGTCVLLCAALLPGAALAEVAAAEEPGRLAAVQRRKFRLDHEIYAAAGHLPLDAFYKGLGPVVSYTWHMSEALGWEVVRGQYSFALSTDLRDQLVRSFRVKPTEFEEAQYLLSTSLLWKPLYGKLAMFNSRVIHLEMFGLLGATVAHFSLGSFKPGPQVGLGFRFFLSPNVSLRVEGRYHFLFGGNGLTKVVDLAAGLSFNLGGTE